MIGRFGHWALDGIVLLFALYAFVFVPLGAHSGYDHARAILGTDAAERAGHELIAAGARLREKLIGSESLPGKGDPVLPRFGAGADDATEAGDERAERPRRTRRAPLQMAAVERESDGFSP